MKSFAKMPFGKTPSAFSQHKYAIHATLLGDDAVCPWTNLGLWRNTCSYVAACQYLANHLAGRLRLRAMDRVLDLGCGQGASLLFWQQYHAVTDITAVELQAKCVEKIQHQPWAQSIQLHQGSFLALDAFHLKQYDVVMCIDALYHHDAMQFLSHVQPYIAPSGRIGFHYLMLNPRFETLTTYQKMKYQYLLKVADINIQHLHTTTAFQAQMHALGYEDITIDDLSQDVFAGFSHYVQRKLPGQHLKSLDTLKIKMTAKLCQKLAQDGLIDYVQVCAKKVADSDRL